jgi:hypothetical protein
VHHHHHHDQDHHHHDAGEPRAQPVVLDLGEGIGALIVRTGPDLLGEEIEISPAGRDGDRQHKQVLLRAAGARTIPALVYDNLAEGEYTLWRDGAACARRVKVTGGEVAQLVLA